MRVLIVGAGIGGLAAAIACAQRGMQPVVLERAEAMGEVGAGIQISPNAVKVLDALCVTDRLRERAVRCEAIALRMGRSGRHLFRIDLNDQPPQWGADYLHIHRADYIDALRSRLFDLAPQALRLNAEMKFVEQNSQSVSVTLADGTKLSGDTLIAADGVRSSIREHLFDTPPPRFNGHVAWRVTVPMDRLGSNAPEAVATAWLGPEKHAVTYQLRSGMLANFVGVTQQPDWQYEGWTEPGEKPEAMDAFSDWYPTITTLLREAEPDLFFRWALFDRPALPEWSQGRIALLGDAAHPMLPFLAQGAAMAVEDAWVIAACLAKESNVETALKTYTIQRHARASQAQTRSRKNGDLFHRRTALSRLMSYAPIALAGHLSPGLVARQLDWLYGADVTEG